MNPNVDSGKSRAEIGRTAPGGCEYLVSVDGRLRECGAPATHQLNRARGLRYCEAHAHHVRTAGKKDVRELQPHERNAK